MKRLVVVIGLLAVVVMATALALPHLVPWIVAARLHAITGRLVRVESATLSLGEGRLTVRGLHVADRDGTAPFVDVARLDVRLSPSELLRRHVWIRELTIVDPAVRVVRLSGNEFNLSDLVRAPGSSSGPGGPPDVTVDRFTVAGGTVTLEDRALPGSRTWRSEQISIEARDVSTRHAGGTAVASSVTDGAPVTVDVRRLRLYPIDFAAAVTVQGADLALARLYMPANAPAVMDRGRADLSVDVAVHATEGLRVDATAQLADVALTRPEDGRPVLQAPLMVVQLADFRVHEAGARVGRFEITGSLTAFDPTVSPAARFELPGLRASATDVTWPLSEPARVELRTGVPGGGLLTAAGILRTAPAPSDVRVRLAKLDLAPWARYLPPRARITGVAEADLRVNEPITAGLPTRVRGSIAINNVGISDGRQKLVGAGRIEATGLQVDWPTRISAGRLLMDQPVALVERDRSGQFPLQALLAGPSLSAGNDASMSESTASSGRPSPESTASSGRPSDSSAVLPSIAVQIGQIAVRNGSATWRDQAVTPPVHLTASRINASVKGSAWPLSGPLGVALDLETPGGGELRIAGTADVRQPIGADVRVVLKAVEVGAYQSYLPTPARVAGRADADVTVRYAGADAGVAVRGQAAVARLDVRDPERTVMRVERATATGLDVQWPERISIQEVALQRPWVLLERDERGQLPLPALLPATSATPADGQPGGKSEAPGPALTVAVQRLGIESGGARIVDRGIQPPFAVDLDRLTAEIDGLSTERAGKPARVSLTGRIAPDAALALQGSVGPLGGPPRVDLRAEVRDFAIPRTNPYLLRQVDWKVREGRLVATIQGQIKANALNARSDIRLRQLALERAGPDDQARAHIGLPLGTLVSLMKNRHGDIALSFPVSGRLNDPRFDFREAIWKAARTVAINAIATPVSWIGRLQFTADSRIDTVQIDPVQFRPGTAILTREGEAQTMRLAGFLEQVPDVRLALTPLVTSGDLARLAEEAPPSERDISALAAKRLEAVTGKLKQAKVDTARLVENKTADRAAAPDGQVRVGLVEDDGSKRSPGLLERLRRLGSG